MRALFVALVVLCSVGRAAFADPDPSDPLYKCNKAPPGTMIVVSFQPDTSLRDLTVWAIGFTCKNIVYSADVARHATAVTIISPEQDDAEAGAPAVRRRDRGDRARRRSEERLDHHQARAEHDPELPGRREQRQRATGAALPAARGTRGRPGARRRRARRRASRRSTIPHITITRALVDKILSNPMAVAKGARVVPAIANGKPSGFKLYAIRPGSIYARLGLANGDTLESINGFELTSADKALEVYTKLREATSLELVVVRSRKPLTLMISIR